MPEETPAASSAASVDEKPCSSSASSSAAAADSADVMEEAKKLIGTGNKHLVMGDVVSAVGVFQEACSMLAARYGDTADECGEALFLCGKSLLELARMENSVLGNALEGVPDSEEEPQPSTPNIESADNLDEQAREELRKQVYEAMAEKSEEAPAENGVVVKTENGVDKSPVKPELNGHATMNGHGSPTPGVKVNGADTSPDAVNGTAESPTASPEKDEPKQNGEDVEKPEGEDGEAQPEDDDDDESEEEEGESGDKEEDEVGNLQLAWEMLELAKVIYKRKENKDDQLMAAQAYLILGQVSIESDNYAQALEDFQECLTLQQKHLPPHSRLLAETHYHVASTLCYIDQYSQAIEHFNSSVKVIEERLAMLQEAITSAAAGASEDDVKEMEELKQLLPDIKEKIEDAKESQRTSLAASQAIKQTLGGASTSSSFSENGGPSSVFTTASQIPVKSAGGSSQVSNISHLVRKKRKPEEESPVKDADAKQSKQEVNGSEDTSARNGVEEQKSQEPATQSASVQSSA
ncbi:nuclear autoantigenic sperm protein [Neosynchiropus ocellatus]